MMSSITWSVFYPVRLAEHGKLVARHIAIISKKDGPARVAPMQTSGSSRVRSESTVGGLQPSEYTWRRYSALWRPACIASASLPGDRPPCAAADAAPVPSARFSGAASMSEVGRDASGDERVDSVALMLCKRPSMMAANRVLYWRPFRAASPHRRCMCWSDSANQRCLSPQGGSRVRQVQVIARSSPALPTHVT